MIPALQNSRILKIENPCIAGLIDSKITECVLFKVWGFRMVRITQFSVSHFGIFRFLDFKVSEFKHFKFEDAGIAGSPELEDARNQSVQDVRILRL